MALILFLLFINELEDLLVRCARDIPFVGKQPIGSLLYADDVVQIARTGWVYRG